MTHDLRHSRVERLFNIRFVLAFSRRSKSFSMAKKGGVMESAFT